MDISSLFKTNCDSCGEPWSHEDLAEPKGIVRLNKYGESRWIVAGFGSGHGQAFVHSRCLELGKRVGSVPGYGDAN